METRRQPNSRACFVCGMENAAGLRVSFYDVVGEGGRPEVLARFTGRSPHQGYPERMHGGLVTGILDETVGRAINAGTAVGDVTVWGVAVELSVRFRLPIPLEVALTARGWITRDRGRLFEGAGELYLPDGRVAAQATGRYVKQPLDEIADVDPEALGWRVYGEPG